MPDANVKRSWMLVIKMAKTVTNTLELSPTRFVSTIILNRITDAKRNYALRTCIDLKPWEGEDQYVRIFQGGGCYSYIGWAYYTQQVLSIGTRCNSQG